MKIEIRLIILLNQKPIDENLIVLPYSIKNVESKSLNMIAGVLNIK
jgi:hypothetical protein